MNATTGTNGVRGLNRRLYRLGALCLAGALMLPMSPARAATFNLPDGQLPADCSASGSTVTCTNGVNLGEEDEVIVDGQVNWEIEGNFAAGEEVSVNTAGTVDDLHITVTGNVSIPEEGNVNANVSAGGSIVLDEEATIGGDVIAGGNVVVGEDGTVGGCVSAGGSVTGAGTINCGQDIALLASRQTVQVGESLQLAVAAQNCTSVNADRWRDTWRDLDGLGVPDDGQRPKTQTSPCDGQRTRTWTVSAAPGTYTIEFESEWCRDGSAGPNTFECPASQAGATDFATFGSDTVQIEVVGEPQPEPLLEYRMEEDAWDGTAGEVSDASGNGHDGTARNGATTSQTEPLPAIPGDPGTCRYGDFDGSDDYIEIPGFPDLEDSFTITGWFRTRDRSEPGQRIFADDENNNAGYAVSLGDGGAGRVRFYHRSLNPIILDTPGVIQNDTWYFVGAVLDDQSSEKHIYIYDSAGNLVDHTQGGFSGTLQSDGGTASVGGETDSGETGNRFNGQIDELRVYDSALSETDIDDIRTTTRPCGSPGLTCTAREFDGALGPEWDTESVSGGFGAPRAEDGVLRLTDASTNVSTRATILDALPWDQNRVEVEFRYFAYGGSTAAGSGGDADGIAVTFSDASVTPVPGGFGGSLGYAQRDDVDGFAGGWLGIGLDEFGNFSNPTEGREGGPGFIPDAVVLRGDGSGQNGYEYIAGTGSLNPPLSSPNEADRSNLTGDLYRIVVDTTDPGTALVQVERDTTGTGDNYQTLLDEDIADDQATDPPEEVFLSFTGATGGETNFHEIDFLEVCANRGLEATVDRYVVSAPGQGLTCVSSAVTIEARDADDNPISPDGGTVLALSTDTGKGTWSRVRSGSGTLTDGTSGDGDGAYEFPGGESSTELSFDYPDIASDPESVVIAVDDGSATGSSDPIAVSLAGFRFLDDDAATAADVVSDQIAGKRSDEGFGASDIGLQALRASDNDPSTCDGVYDDGETATVEFGAECRDPDTCELATASVNGSAVAASDDNGNPGEPAAFDPVDLTFGPDSTAPLTLRYDDAGAIRLYARDEITFDDPGGSPSGEFLRGTSNDFVVRPFGFYLDFDPDHPDGDTVFDDRATNAACADQTSCAANADGDVFATAGVDFPVRIEAVVWQAADDGNDDGVPDSNQALADNAATPNFGQEAAAEVVDLDRSLVAPGGGSPGTLAGGQDIGDPNDQAFSNGSIETGGVSWDSVGIIDLGASLDSGTYLGSDDVIGTAPNLGRFIPARLEATGNNPAFEPFCDAGTAFTYLDQAFGYATDPRVTVTAYNANGAVTANYGAAFWQLPVPAALPNRAYTDQSPATGALTDAPGTVSWADGGDDGLSGSDTATIAGERLTYGRNAPETPFPASADLTIPAGDLTDSDGVCLAGGGICNTGDGDTGDDFVFDGDGGAAGQQPIGGTQLRFGRLRLDDAFGPETAPVEQRWQLDFWTGSTWARNNDDGCTVLALADEVELDPDDNPGSGNEVDGTQEVDLSSGDGSTRVAQPTPDVMGNSILFTGGSADVRYEAPGAGNRGWIETRALLADDFPHLLADTDGDGAFDNEPAARVTFGLFAGEQEQIYLRELYPLP